MALHKGGKCQKKKKRGVVSAVGGVVRSGRNQGRKEKTRVYEERQRKKGERNIGEEASHSRRKKEKNKGECRRQPTYS